jgi:tetratricopeptide (TPR) repeat protein
MIKVKTFIQALSLFSTKPKKSKRFLEDKRLTQAEKTILRGYFLLRDSKFKEIKILLDNISEITDPVVQSQYHLLLGIVYNNMNDFKLAQTEISKSLEFLPQKELKYFEFVAHLNLFIINYNIRNVDEMKLQLELMKKFDSKEAKDKIRTLSCEYLYHSFVEKFDEAEKVLNSLDALKSKMTESDVVPYLLQKFEFSVRVKNFVRAKSILAEMKKNRKFALSENYRYIKKLLEHYTEHKPLYFQDHEFEKQPFLLYHIKVVQLMEERKLDEAAIWWNKLSLLYPESYKENFQYFGPVNIFSLCFKMHQGAIQENIFEIDESLDKTEVVIELLEKAQGPVSREVLFKLLWKREPKDKEDFVRLSRKIYRMKIQKNLNIEYRKGCYMLLPTAKKKVA